MRQCKNSKTKPQCILKKSIKEGLNNGYKTKNRSKKAFALTTSKTFRGPNRTSNVNYREGKSSVNLRVHGSPTKVSGTYILGKRKIRL